MQMNLQELNQIQQETWTAGDFPKMGVELAIVGELLCEFVPLHAGDRALDVGTASGNTALAAARRRAVVTGVDITPALLKRARLRVPLPLETAVSEHLSTLRDNRCCLPQNRNVWTELAALRSSAPSLRSFCTALRFRVRQRGSADHYADSQQKSRPNAFSLTHQRIREAPPSAAGNLGRTLAGPHS
jgi:SAM-dependent methyltransferase